MLELVGVAKFAAATLLIVSTELFLALANTETAWWSYEFTVPDQVKDGEWRAWWCLHIFSEDVGAAH